MISDKRDFKAKSVKRDKSHFTLTKNVTILNIYAPNTSGCMQFHKENATEHKTTV